MDQRGARVAIEWSKENMHRAMSVSESPVARFTGDRRNAWHRGSSGRLPRLVIRLVVVVGLLSALVGCGGYYYRATIRGYVVDAETENGINGARIRLYSKEPSGVDDTSFFAEQVTADSGGNAGYYSATVIWSDLRGSYGAEGDTQDVYAYVLADDYLTGELISLRVLSDTTNTLADIELRRAFRVREVSGTVTNWDGETIGGVRLVLDVEPPDEGAEDEDDEDYVVQSATTGDDDPEGNGDFVFDGVAWESETSAVTGETQTTTARLIVDDPDYGWDTTRQSQAAPLTAGAETGDPSYLPVTLTAGTDITALDIRVKPIRFQVDQLRVRVVDSSGTGINGVALRLSEDPTDDNPQEYAATTATIDDRAGTGQFPNVSWEDLTQTDPDAAVTSTWWLAVDDAGYVQSDTTGWPAVGDDAVYTDSEVDPALTWVPVSLTAGDEATVSRNVVIVPTRFAAPALWGRVIREGTSEGINGLTVVLDIEPYTEAVRGTAPPDVASVQRDYVAVTGDRDGRPGWFTFNNIAWDDADAGTTTSTVGGRVYLDDDVYEPSADAYDDPDETTEVTELATVTIQSGSENELTEALSATRREGQTSYATELVGALLWQSASDQDPRGVQGVSVTIAYENVRGSGATITREATTNGAGEFTFLIEWSLAEGVTAAGEASTTDAIPPREDTLSVALSYSHDYDGGGADFAKSAVATTVRSWVTPNRVPDDVQGPP